MRPLQAIAIIFYTIIFLVIGALFICISADLITAQQILQSYYDYNVKSSIGMLGGVLILLSILISHFTFGSIQRERTIAFSTQDGQVIISLSAIENFIKKLGEQMPEIKDMRSSVFARKKKGVSISVRISLWSGANIADITEKIQSTIKSKVQDILPIEEPITTKVHVVKIVHSANSKKKAASEEAAIEPPYRSF